MSHTSRLACPLLAALLIGLAPGARAEEPAQQHPTKDVDVVYKAPPANAPKMLLPKRIRFSAAANVIRVDAVDGMWVLQDIGKQVITLAYANTKAATVVPGASVGRMELGAEAHWEKRGTLTVAGQTCTRWQVVAQGHQGMTQCYTEDGVMLKSEANGITLAEAQSVTYAPQPADLFVVPKDYKVTQNMRMHF